MAFSVQSLGRLAGRSLSNRAPASRRVILRSSAPVPVARQCSRPALQVFAAAKTASTVKMVIQGRKLPVTDSIKQYVENKISHALSHYGQEIKEVNVTLSARGGDTGTHGRKEQKVEVTVFTLRNGVVRVEDAEDTLYASIDLVCDKLERKMNRIKERAISKGKWPGRAGPKAAELEEAEFKEYLNQVKYETAVFDKEEALAAELAKLNSAYPSDVVRTKVLDLVPMSVEDAIEAMEAVGHSFYVFRDKSTDSMQVVYRREAQGYGVLIPRMSE